MQPKRKMIFMRVMPVALLFLVAFDLFVFHLAHGYEDKIPHLQTSIAVARKKASKAEYHDKHPVIRKTVPSAFKKMMSDGKQVQDAENKLMQITRRNHGKVRFTSNTAEHEKNILRQYISGGTDGDVYNALLTNHLKDSIKLIPGSSDASGDYIAAFVAVSPSHTIDNVIAADYHPSEDQFNDLKVYGPYNVLDASGQGNVSKSKKSKKHPKATKKNLKKIKKGVAKKHKGGKH